ncbi:MAG: flagellar biosynthetic protein FliO [Spirochaetia bacterium]|jgi:flagellar biosynthetic protein FliO
MALALAGQPLAAQAKQTPTGAASAAGNESEILLPDAGTPGTGSATGTTVAPQGSPAAPPAVTGVSTWDFVRMLIILACVVGVIYLLFWILRRSSGKKIQENDLIRVLGSRSLAGNRALHLIEVGGCVYLVGASDGGVQLISEITDKESLDSVRLKAAEQPASAGRSFPQILSEIFRPARKPVSLGEGIGFLRGQRDRLKKL